MKVQWAYSFVRFLFFFCSTITNYCLGLSQPLFSIAFDYDHRHASGSTGIQGCTSFSYLFLLLMNKQLPRSPQPSKTSITLTFEGIFPSASPPPIEWPSCINQHPRNERANACFKITINWTLDGTGVQRCHVCQFILTIS